MKNFSDKISYFFLTCIMLAIMVSFAFTGFEGISGSSNSVATVDGTPVTRREYNMAYEQLLSRYSQTLGGGKSLTTKQIKDFRIREMALQQAIRSKYLLNFANEMNLEASSAEIKDQIKKYPFFKTGENFDVNKYKQLLAANKLTPAKFEEDTAAEIKMMKLNQLLAVSGIESKSFVKERLNYQSQEANAWVVTFAKEDMTKNIDVSNKEVNDFIATEGNKNTIDSLYKTYKAKADFDKQTAKPLSKVKNELVKKHLQKTKRKELSELNEKIKKEVAIALERGKKNEVNKVVKKYDLEFIQDTTISPLNVKIKNAEIDFEELLPMFKNKNTNKVVQKENQTHVTYFKMTDYKNKPVTDEEVQKELEQSKNYGSFGAQQAIVTYSENNAKVTTRVTFD